MLWFCVEIILSCFNWFFTGSEDLSDTRNLVEEIHMRTQQLPLTKQDSYANAIYNSATRAQQARKGLRKQGIY